MTVRTAELVMAIFLAIASIGIMVKAAELSIGWIPKRGPGAGAWPFWLALIMLLSCFATIFRWVRRATPESRSEEQFMSAHTLALVGVTVGALLGLLIGTVTIGIYFSLLAFVFFYVKILGRHGWGISIVLTIATPVVIFMLFEWALTIPLPKGISEPLFYPIYDLIY